MEGNDAGASGVDVKPASAPSIDDMIAASHTDSNNDASSTIRIIMPDASKTAGNAGGVGDAAPRKRGRPAGSGAQNRASGAQPKKSKADLQADYDRLQSELAAERARGNAEAVAELAQMVEMGVFLFFGTVASKRGEHWNITKTENENIGKTGGLALAPHAETLRKYAPWGMFAATLGGAIYQRLQIDKANYEAHQAREATLSGNATTPTTGM